MCGACAAPGRCGKRMLRVAPGRGVFQRFERGRGGAEHDGDAGTLRARTTARSRAE